MNSEQSSTAQQNWPLARLGDIADIVNGAGFPEIEQGHSDLQIPFVKVSDMNTADEAGIIRSAANSISTETARRLGARVCPAGTVVFPKVGGALLTNKKRVLGLPAVFDNNVMGAVPRSVAPLWLYFWLLSVDLAALANTQALPSIRQSQVANLEIPLPPVLEQERLATKLSRALATIDTARHDAEARLAAAESLPAAYLREVFDGPGASAWEIVSAGDIAQISGGVQKSPGRAPRNHHCAYLTVRNVQRGSLDLSQVERFEVTPAELDRLRLRKGDILVVEGNGSPDQIGRNAIFNLNETDWIHQNHVIRVRLGESATPQFISLFLNSPAGKAQMMERARSTSGLYTLSVDKVGSLQLPLPPLADQRRIAERLSGKLSAADYLVRRCREELAAIEALPAAVLRAAFNGES